MAYYVSMLRVLDLTSSTATLIFMRTPQGGDWQFAARLT